MVRAVAFKPTKFFFFFYKYQLLKDYKYIVFADYPMVRFSKFIHQYVYMVRKS